jgi:hypothetical protein
MGSTTKKKQLYNINNMESLDNAETFESFKNRVTEIFKNESLSENLLSEIDIWHNRRYEEIGLPGGTIEQRVVFHIEFSELYISTGRPDLAYDTLSDAWTEADQEGLTDLVKKITDLMNHINSLV